MLLFNRMLHCFAHKNGFEFAHGFSLGQLHCTLELDKAVYISVKDNIG